MNDREIKLYLDEARLKAVLAKLAMHPLNSRMWAAESVTLIHHIINSIDWEG